MQVSGEYGKEDGVPSGGFGGGPAANGRDWFRSPVLQVRPIAQTNDGRPQIFDVRNAQQFQYTKYGLITNGPLQGTAFGAGGTPYQFQYGSNGVPTGTGQVTNCITPFCVGGDLSGNVNMGPSLAGGAGAHRRLHRVGFDVGERTQVYRHCERRAREGNQRTQRGHRKAGQSVDRL